MSRKIDEGPSRGDSNSSFIELVHTRLCSKSKAPVMMRFGNFYFRLATPAYALESFSVGYLDFVDRCYIASFSALGQTHCTRVVCDCQ